MSRAGKPKGKKAKGQTADREEETRFIEDGANTGQKTGHGKSPGASAVSRGGDGPVETSSNADHEASGEGDPLKKRKKSFGKRMMRSIGRSSSSSTPSSKTIVQSATSSSLAAVGDAGRQSEATEESPSGSDHQSATSHRVPVPVQSRNEIVADLHSNVVDMAREISHYIDPKNVLPSVQCCHHLTPPEVKRVVEVLSGQEQLREHKPQNYCFAVLPAINQRQSVLLDYTGTFRPSPDDEVRPLHMQEEDGLHTPPITPTTELPWMLTQDADVAANLPDSEKVKRLEKALDGHIRLHADMEEEMRRKTDEVERGQNEIADLRREMDARDEELRIQGEEIRVLKESLREKEQEIKEKLQSIEDFHAKVEQRDRQLDYLKKPSNEAELSPKALEEYDLYFDHVLTLTEELTDSEATGKKQQQELEMLRKLVERAERMEELATCDAVELSEKDQEIKEFSECVQTLQHTTGSGDAELQDRPFERVDRALDDVTQVKHEASQRKGRQSTQKETLATQNAELSKLRGEVGALRKENDDLRGEIEALKVQAVLWEEDFRKERHDREQAAGRRDDERAHLHIRTQEDLQKLHTRIHQLESENKRLQDEISVHQNEMKNYQQVMTNFDHIQLRLVQHKDQVANLEQLLQTQQQEHKAQLEQANQLQQTQLEDVHQQLKQANQQLDQAVTDNEKLNEDVLAKTQQVKQYKKQVDGLKAEVMKYKSRVTSNQEVDAEKTQQITNLRRQLQARQHHQEVASQQLRGEIQRLSNQLQVQSSGRASQSDELAPYNVPYFSVVPGEEKGSGSYGSVHLIEVNGVPCIAKQLHDILVGRNREEAVGVQQQDAIQRKFRNECILLSRLKHPNIVQFMGIHYDYRDPSNLTLIMECLPMDLEKCLKLYPNLPLSTIISILLDVSYGLLHLHSQMPPIIHRDLTAANILLTCDMKAKLADLGVSKILELNPLLASAQSALPGTLAYMPPEALVEKPRYDTKLDVFSFGVVALYAAIKEFPLMYENVSVEAVQNREIQIEKRRVWIRQMGVDHCLHGLVIQCLKDDPAERPSTHNINAMLKQLSHQHPKKFQNVLQMCSQIESLEQQVSASHQQLTELWAQTVQLQREREELLGRGMGQNVQQIHPMQQGVNVQSPTAVNTRYYRRPTVQPAAGPAQPQYGLQPSYPVPRPRHNRSPYPPQQ